MTVQGSTTREDVYQQGYEEGRRVEAARWLALMVDALALSRGAIDSEEFRRRLVTRADAETEHAGGGS